ncbi:MAG TPA: DUF4149 domain-containing protein [Tepidisphaeraceae bacterium]|jgi:hypothetical protein|nr:DUF4149 domain-containing protein [Tepidisphaeraceae bacterium]
MSRLFAFITLLAWALWLGGLVTLFICVITLFHHDRSLAANVAPKLFVNFERYQLILAAVVLTTTVVWRIVTKNVLINWVFLLLCLASLGAIASPLYFSRQMEALREQGKTGSLQFQSLHKQSEWVYTGEVSVLAICGIALFFALRRAVPEPQKSTTMASP